VKWFYRLLTVIILVGALSLPFYADYRSGGSFLNLASIPSKVAQAIPESFEDMRTSIVSRVNSIGGASNEDQENPTDNITGSTQNQAYYRWQDEHGQWHFSDEAPAGKSERAILKPEQLSTISAMDESLIQRTMNQGKASSTSSLSAAPNFSESTATPSLENVSELVQNAQHAAQLMNERNQALHNISSQ